MSKEFIKDNEMINHYDYHGYRIEIYQNDKDFYYRVLDYDDNNILNDCLYDCNKDELYFDDEIDAKDEAEYYIDNEF